MVREEGLDRTLGGRLGRDRRGAALMLAFVQYFDEHALISLACIATIILAAGATPTPRLSKWVEKAAQVSFSIFITNQVVRIAWFGVANVTFARLALPRSGTVGSVGRGRAGGLRLRLPVPFHRGHADSKPDQGLAEGQGYRVA